MPLHISKSLSLPDAAVTRTFGILGMRGSGKSNAAVVMAEEMFRAGHHFVVLDPKGDWWGLRSQSDRKPGLPIPIFGGRHADLPLEPSAGSYIADLVVDQTLTCILDLSEFTEGEKTRFLAGPNGRDDGFALRLYRRKNEEQPPTHLFLEEADDYLPQRVGKEKAKLLHDCSKLILWGRQRGLGGTYVTQRSARINKDILTQSETMIVFRTTGPQDRDAVKDWVKYHGQSEELIASLSELGDGESWVWSPEWLRVMERVQWLRRKTYDSGATPVVGKKHKRTPATLADVDLGAIEKSMAASIEKARARDPEHLQRRIRELEAEARKKPVSVAAPKVDIEATVEKAVQKALAAQRKEIVSHLAKLPAKLTATVKEYVAEFGDMSVGHEIPKVTVASVDNLVRVNEITRDTRNVYSAKAQAVSNGNGKVAPVHQRILDGLAELEAIGLPEPSRIQVALMANYTHPASTGFVKAIGALSSGGLIHYPSSGKIGLTNEGRAQASTSARPLSSDELQQRAMRLLQPVQAKILGVVIDLYPGSIERQTLAEATGYTHVASTGFVKALGRLSSLGLVSYPQSGRVAAASLLFLGETQ